MNTKKLVTIAMIAAIYTVLTLILAPISFSNIQIRISESLTMLPLIYQPGIYGVTLGCFLANLIGAMTGVNPTGMIDAVVGTAATLIAAILTWKFRDRKIKGIPVLSILMPVVLNFFFVGIELGVLFFPDNVVTGSLICGLEVAAGEIVAVILGYILVGWLKKSKVFEDK
ncbi:MAG: QueT transporter family protein [Erysipelotrichaceae bacterium]|nr:QueT transporter family protein [Erysipelotrichaceae bacterium]